MTDEHTNCKYSFWKWLVQYATKNQRIYWLLWGLLVALIVCAYKFGLTGIL